MMPFKPYLIVKRLVITNGKNIAYDECFKEGVNIIRGNNSSGKSTITDFIFYALGGELTRWKQEASSCDHTYIEVDLSGSLFTLRREIRESSKAGMDIIEGSYEATINKNTTDWLRYPYSATENKESFYQVILKELGIPYSQSDSASSLTLHQILRLMYVDQMTSLDRLFKFDHFDNANKRKAIGELLIGLSDLSLYQNRVRLQLIDKKLTSIIDDINVLHKFFGKDIKTAEQIEHQIQEKQAALIKLESDFEQGNKENKGDHPEQGKITNLRQEIKSINENLKYLEDKRIGLNLELTDSERFVNSLLLRIQALEDTSKTIDVLSNIGFKYCPACFQATHSRSINECCLCGMDKTNAINLDPTFKIRKEIDFQLHESNRLIALRQKDLTGIDIEIDTLKNMLKVRSSELNIIEQPLRMVNQETRELLIKIGSTTKDIEQLIVAKSKFSNLYELYKERAATQLELDQLKDTVQKQESSIEKEMNRKKNMISNYTLAIIQADNNHEEAFKNASKIEFDFGEDRVSVDDRVLFSASSMVYLKNSFRLALLEAACNDSSFLYPRFLLMDNVEDKGMEPSRSHTFQNEIIRVSANIRVPHQIIFTTSMIDPDLDGTIYCVGEFYDENNKTLKV